MNKKISFIINKLDFRKSEFIEEDIEPLQENQALLKIEKFSFTANNISYVNLGESFGYWKFFPTKDGFGIPPVWGIATIIQSKNPDLKVGDTVYGFFPASTHLLIEANKVRPAGFTDTTPHRAKLPSLYNYYYLNQNDPFYKLEKENSELIFRPLFTTSFLLMDFILSNQIFNSDRIILTSASSKTALALAYLLNKEKKQNNQKYSVLALTSSKNKEFLIKQGYFDSVNTYEEMESIPKESSVVIDFAGNKTILKNLKDHLGEKLNFLSLVGLVHWEEKVEEKDSIGGTLFFAPTYVKKRTKDWGIDGFQNNLADKYFDFIDIASLWMHFEEKNDKFEFQKLYLEILEGKVTPDKGYIFKL
jgi:hypothetical protein